MSDAAFTFTSRFLLGAAQVSGIPQDVLAKRVRKVFHRLTQRVDPTITLEIGAFEAGFSRWARTTLPEARVTAFEANPYVYDRFRDEVTAAGVEYLNAAVGPETGTVKLNLPVDRNGTVRDKVNQIASLTTHHRTENYEIVEVEGVRLDDAVPTTANDRVVAWIDVEGALDVVLAGSKETLSRAAAVYVEVERTPMAPAQWLDVDVARWFREIGMVPILRDLQRPHQYNLLLVSEALALDRKVAKIAASVYAPVEAAAPAAPEPGVPRSKVSRIQGVLQRTLGAQNDQLRAQNKQLRQHNRRLRRRLEDRAGA